MPELRASRRARALLLVVALLLAAPVEAVSPDAGSVDVQTACFDARFDLEGARPIRLITRVVGGPASGAAELDLWRPFEPDPWRVVGDADAGLESRLVRLRYAVERREDGQGVTLVFRAPLEPGVDVVQRYTFARQTCSIDASMNLEGAQARGRRLALELVATSGFAREVAGLGGFAERLVAVGIDRDGARELGTASGNVELGAGRWVGVRGRFWALLVSAGERSARVRVRGPTVGVRATGGDPLEVRLYVGPIDANALGSVDPSLSGLLFSGRSAPVRALCVGLAAPLGALLAWLGQPWLAVVLLAIGTRLLLLPLTRIAERHRAGVLAVALQLPVWIAAFHVLDESIALLGARLLWIEDLSLPDRLATLPFRVPLFGDAFSLLPFLLAGAVALAVRRQRAVVAAGCFLLSYTMPSGMVLYSIAHTLGALPFRLLGARMTRARSLLGASVPDSRA